MADEELRDRDQWPEPKPGIPDQRRWDEEEGDEVVPPDFEAPDEHPED